MRLKPLAAILCAAACFASPARAEEHVTRLWESAAQFRAPESVLPDLKRGRLYVSNVDGEPAKADGKGFISLLGMDGKLIRLEWVTGLNAPTGMALVGDRLYVADIDRLVEIDAASGKILKRYRAPGAKFLNDVSADRDGKVYVSGMLTNRIYRLYRGRLEKWLESPALANPNGVSVRGGKLFVASWGVMQPGGFATEVPGHVRVVSLKDRHIEDYGGERPVGNLDGLEPLADGSLLATDWMAGRLMRIRPDGSVSQLEKLHQGAADIGYLPRARTVFVPLMNDGKVVALRLDP